ncbi:Pumilio like protein 4 [Astathelohania contejeani]|uniref:Pumilio like protein 4 n=1 Tax=Astathelohania contejeani TaxID=164912 RepID=A0ABQ7I2Y3_9MICR|nr:Pumilio like protein 4 [Thelohania contejeani]
MKNENRNQKYTVDKYNMQEYTRCSSAPPVEKLFIEGDHHDIYDIAQEITYSTFYRRNSRNDPRLPLPEFFILGQSSFGMPDGALFRPSLLDRIDEDYPYAERSSEYKGSSRATTPIGHDIHSPLLRSIDSKNEFMDELRKFKPLDKNLCLELSKDQHGSRLIQKRLETASEEEREWFFGEISGHILELVADLFGNYVIQKLFDVATNTQRAQLVEGLRGVIYTLSTHMYGCRVIQKALDTVSDISPIIEELRGNILALIEDQNGNHVIQKCVERTENREFIISEFLPHAVLLAKHRYGCRVIQRLFEHSKGDECEEVIQNIISSLDVLIEDQYGNYVIQHIIEHSPYRRSEVILSIANRIHELSMHKFASNVVEKCVLMGSDEDLRVITESLFGKQEGKPILLIMSVDKFGNYVVQRLLDTKYSSRIIEIIKPFIGEMKKSIFAKHILNRINVK